MVDDNTIEFKDSTMNFKLTATVLLSIATSLITIPAPASAQEVPPPAPEAPIAPTSPLGKANQIGPSLSFGGGSTVFGVDSRFPISSVFSLRPSVRFPSGGFVFGSSVTYDFPNLGAEFGLEPFAGAGFNIYTGDNNNSGTNFVGYAIGGADYALSNQFNLTGSVNIPFQNGYSTDVAVGVAYKF
jgi:hypothetical protein